MNDFHASLDAAIARQALPPAANDACRCQIVGWSRDPYEPHIPAQPEWEQADDCPVHPRSKDSVVAVCGVTFSHDWHGYLDDAGKTSVCDGEPRPNSPAVGREAGAADV